jgi:hypothetical protein
VSAPAGGYVPGVPSIAPRADRPTGCLQDVGDVTGRFAQSPLRNPGSRDGNEAGRRTAPGGGHHSRHRARRTARYRLLTVAPSTTSGMSHHAGTPARISPDVASDVQVAQPKEREVAPGPVRAQSLIRSERSERGEQRADEQLQRSRSRGIRRHGRRSSICASRDGVARHPNSPLELVAHWSLSPGKGCPKVAGVASIRSRPTVTTVSGRRQNLIARVGGASE